jgi:hypothetical protein
MPVFYPSCVVNLKLRFDEALHVVTTPDPVSTDGRAEAPATGAAQHTLEPLILQRGSANASFVLNRVPKKASVELPGYRQAGTFNLTFDFKELPIDPRTVRAAAVEIHLGAVRADDFAAGMRGRDGNNQRRSILRTRDDAGGVRQDTLLLVGNIDVWKVDHSDHGSEVTMEGRDLRGILLDSPLNPAVLEQLELHEDIVAVVQQILEFHPLGEQFTVEVNAAEWPDQTIPSPLSAGLIPRHRRGARGTRRGGRGNAAGASQQLNYWDAIVRFCYLVGAIPYFRGTKLWIRPTRSIFDQERAGFDPAIATPFLPDQPREVGGVQFSVRRLVYGRDVEKLHFERKFAGHARPKTVRCVAINQSDANRGLEGPVVEGRWPLPETSQRGRGARTHTVAAGGQQSQEDVINIAVPGVADPARLQEIARNIFEEIGRNEMGGSVETKNLASFGGDNQDPDLLRLRPGDGVEFYVDRSQGHARAPIVSTAGNFARAAFEEAVRDLRTRISDESLCRVIVATARGQVAELQRWFRTSNVKYDWNADKGVGISFDFQNYFVQRFNVGASVGTDAGTVRRATSGRAT